MKKIELPMEEIIKKYESRVSAEKIASEYGTSYSTIYSRIKEYYEEKQIKRYMLKKKYTPIELPIEEIAKKYEKGISTQKLATEYETSYFTIYSRLKRYYEEKGVEKPVIRKKSTKIELPIEEIVEKYEAKISVEDLATEYNVSRTTINVRLRQYYEEKQLKRPVIKECCKKIELPIEEIVEKYEAGINEEDLATEYGVSCGLINKRLKEYYKSKGKIVPRMLKSLTVIEEYLKKGLTIEEITEIASKRNVIIPQDLINTIINNKSISDDDQR